MFWFSEDFFFRIKSKSCKSRLFFKPCKTLRPSSPANPITTETSSKEVYSIPFWCCLCYNKHENNGGKGRKKSGLGWIKEVDVIKEIAKRNWWAKRKWKLEPKLLESGWEFSSVFVQAASCPGRSGASSTCLLEQRHREETSALCRLTRQKVPTDYYSLHSQAQHM